MQILRSHLMSRNALTRHDIRSVENFFIKISEDFRSLEGIGRFYIFKRWDQGAEHAKPDSNLIRLTQIFFSRRVSSRKTLTDRSFRRWRWIDRWQSLFRSRTSLWIETVVCFSLFLKTICKWNGVRLQHTCDNNVCSDAVHGEIIIRDLSLLDVSVFCLKVVDTSIPLLRRNIPSSSLCRHQSFLFFLRLLLFGRRRSAI